MVIEFLPYKMHFRNTKTGNKNYIIFFIIIIDTFIKCHLREINRGEEELRDWPWQLRDGEPHEQDRSRGTEPTIDWPIRSSGRGLKLPESQIALFHSSIPSFINNFK